MSEWPPRFLSLLRSQGPSVSDARIDAFEQEHGFKFSDEHRRFLRDVANGGIPTALTPIPVVVDCRGGAGTLQGVYGIDHPAEYLDLGGSTELMEYLPRFVPFGYDDGGDVLFLEMKEQPGKVVYGPLEELWPEGGPFTYFVANSLVEFFDAAEKLAPLMAEEYQISMEGPGAPIPALGMKRRSDFQMDRVIGQIILLLSGLEMMLGLFVMMLSMRVYVGWTLVAMALFHVVCGIGVLRNNRAGLLLAVVLAFISLTGGGAGMIAGAGIGLYAILRLWGNVGPRPA